MNKYYLFKDVKNKTRIPHNSTVELIKWARNRNVLLKYNGETIKSMGYHLRKLKFNEVKEEIISKLSYKNRNISPSDLKIQLKEKGFFKLCIGCGEKLTGRNTSWCNGNCSYEFYSRYIWSNLRSKLIKKERYICQSCKTKSCDGAFPLEVHHIFPIALGGNPFDEENLIVVCPDCHLDAHFELGITMKDYRDKEYYLNYVKENKIKTLDKFMDNKGRM